jgi:Na+/H+ antiporter NhaD/arsenite permease-like protein
MIGSAANIDFNTFLLHMGGIVFFAWLSVIFALKYLFKKELSVIPFKPDFSKIAKIKDRATWNASLIVLGIMVVLFIFHHHFGWDAWVVSAIGFTILLFLAPTIELDSVFQSVEITLLTFFIALFVLVGGVHNSHFLEYLGTMILPFVEKDLMTSALLLMWIAAFLSAMIDNIPFTAAMIPVIMGLEAQGINITPLWWSLAIGVGLGGNGSHLGSTANVYIVTLSERVAKERNDPSLAITPGVWFKKGTPAMLATLLSASLIMWIFFDFFSK